MLGIVSKTGAKARVQGRRSRHLGVDEKKVVVFGNVSETFVLHSFAGMKCELPR